MNTLATHDELPAGLTTSAVLKVVWCVRRNQIAKEKKKMRKWIVELPITPKSTKSEEGFWRGMASSVETGSDHVVVKGVDAEDQECAISIAVQAATRFLDQFSFFRSAFHEIVSDSRSYKVVNEETGECSRGLPATVGISGRVIRKVMDVNGNVVATYDSDRPGRLPGGHTAAMSYYRRGGCAKDLYECLRNKCLAIENVVSLVCYRDQIVNTNETERYQHAIRTLYRDPERAKNLKSAWKGSRNTDLDDLGKHIYQHVRCQLNHAKDDRARRLPYDENDVKAVKRDQHLVDIVARDLIRSS